MITWDIDAIEAYRNEDGKTYNLTVSVINRNGTTNMFQIPYAHLENTMATPPFSPTEIKLELEGTVEKII